MNINHNNSKSKSLLAWPLLAIGTTALVMSAIGVNAQNQTATSNLPLPPRITEEAPPLPEDGPPAPPRDGDPDGPPAPPRDGGPDGRGPGRDGVGHRGMRPGRGDGPGGGPGGMRPSGPKDGPGRGPRRDGPRPSPEDANTPEGSARSLERAYRTAGEVGNVDGEAREVSNQARALYSQALVAYNAKNYTKAFQLAEGSERLSRTADALDHAGDTSLPKVAGLTPPPVVKQDDAKSIADRAAHDLNRAYRETDRAKEFDTPFSKQWSAKAESNYRAALTAYNDKRYDEAARRARLSAEQSKVAREYGETMKS